MTPNPTIHYPPPVISLRNRSLNLEVNMKSIIGLIALILAGPASAHAATTQTLTCSSGPNFDGTVVVDLDNSMYDVGSGYIDAVNARLDYMYSSVGQMVCEGLNHNGNFNSNCVGYYAGSSEITEVKIRTEGRQILALWSTSKGYGNKAMRSVCTLADVK